MSHFVNSLTDWRWKRLQHFNWLISPTMQLNDDFSFTFYVFLTKLTSVRSMIKADDVKATAKKNTMLQ